MLMDISELPRVALDRMNRVHEEEIKILNKLYQSIVEGADIEEIDRNFREFLEDVVNHFTSEQKMMEEFNFFAFPMHKGEHDIVLGQLENLKKNWEKEKNPELIKAFVENEFLPWLMNHIQTMDAVTAHFLSHFIRD
ncbi:bacteriohemerythrin [Persephonella sp.]